MSSRVVSDPRFWLNVTVRNCAQMQEASMDSRADIEVLEEWHCFEGCLEFTGWSVDDLGTGEAEQLSGLYVVGTRAGIVGHSCIPRAWPWTPSAYQSKPPLLLFCATARNERCAEVGVCSRREGGGRKLRASLLPPEPHALPAAPRWQLFIIFSRHPIVSHQQSCSSLKSLDPVKKK